MVPFGRYPAPHALKRTKRPETRNPSVAVGQTRTSSLGAARPLPPSADIGPGGQSVGQAAQFCLVHHRALGTLFDHLVRAGEQHGRDGDAERSCRVEVYHKFKFRRLLDGQVRRLCTL